MKVGDIIRDKIRSFLQIEPAQRHSFSVQEELDFAGTAFVNALWYRGDASELSQFYSELGSANGRFWSVSQTRGLEIRRLHTGLPQMIVDKLAGIVAEDFNGITIDDGAKQQIWDDIAAENRLNELLTAALTGMLIEGDGAFKVSFDSTLSELPIIEWYDGANVEFSKKRGRLYEVEFLTDYYDDKRRIGYVLHEYYGRGYVRYRLTRDKADGIEVELSVLPQTAGLNDVIYDDSFVMAVPMLFGSSKQFRGRGKSVYAGKLDSFDALDETYSQWIQAQRQSRPNTYIPDKLIPRDPKNGKLLKHNPFDNRFIEISANMAEGANDRIVTEQAQFPSADYNATFITALDEALMGVISPSTLGIDVKKLDNAEAQREKEKTTLYTRGRMIGALTEALSQLVDVVFKAYATAKMQTVEDTKCTVKFGEYANPSFEAVIETMSNPNTPMSIEAKVEEIWGDSKDDEWKSEEVTRIKAQMGIAELTEPSFGDASESEPAPVASTLNGAQISSLMNMIAMVKAGTITRSEGIAIVTSTLGISREVAEGYFEQAE